MDDVVLINTNRNTLQEMLDITYKVASRYRIKFGSQKSKVLTIRKPDNHKTLTKLIIKSKKHGLTHGEKIKEQLVDIESKLLKSRNNEILHDENKALDRIKSDPSYFSKYAKKFSKTATEVGPLLNANGVLVNDKRSVSEMLLKQFSSVFSTPSANHAIYDIPSLFHDNDQIHSNLNPKLTDIIFTRESVEAAIKSLKANSAPGQDGMTSELLSNCASVISEPLASLFSKSMHEASVPSLFKQAAVVPIYKGRDRSDPSNYRPVSLTPILMKIMEKIVREKWWLSYQKTIFSTLINMVL